jgi:hypothetical protein
MFASKSPYLSGSPLQVRLLALPTNIRQGRKGLKGTNTLASFVNYGLKKFYKIDSRTSYVQNAPRRN